jgi:hypothetical protein
VRLLMLTVFDPGSADRGRTLPHVDTDAGRFLVLPILMTIRAETFHRNVHDSGFSGGTCINSQESHNLEGLI